MSTVKHAPGPWAAGTEDGDPIMSGCVFEMTGGRMVCSMTGYFPWQQRLANARLIAAAPDLLDALAGLMEACGALRGTPAADTTAEAKARAAISKATGEQQ